MNFYKKIDNIFKRELKEIKKEHEINIEIKEFKGIPENFYTYFYLINKTLPLSPSKVNISKELKDKIKSKNTVIENKYLNALHKIIKNIEEGKSILPYQQRNLYKKDTLFDIFNINHLHLNNKLRSEKEGEKIIERSDWLLFFTYSSGEVYLIDIDKHLHNSEWLYEKGEKIVLNNWPEIHEKYIVPGVTAVKDNFTKNEKFNLAKNGITLINNINNTFLCKLSLNIICDKLLNCLLRFKNKHNTYNKSKIYPYDLIKIYDNILLINYDLNDCIMIQIPTLNNNIRY